VPTNVPNRPPDATLSVTKAARLLGVHPNTIRAWSDAGRLRYYRINTRGDRRYRLGDLQRFLAAAEQGASDGFPTHVRGTRGARRTHATTVRTQRDHASERRTPTPAVDPLDAERHHLDLTVASAISRLIDGNDDPDDALHAAVHGVRDAYGHHLVALWEARGVRLVPRAVARADPMSAARPADLPASTGIFGETVRLAGSRERSGRGPLPAVLVTDEPGDAALAILGGGRPELAVVIPGAREPWGVLHVVGETPGSLSQRDVDIARVVADGIGAIVSVAKKAGDLAHRLHRVEALRRVATDIGSRLDLDRILAGLVDHAMALFEGDRGAVFLQHEDGLAVAGVSRGLSSTYLASVRDLPWQSLRRRAVAARRPLFSVGYRDDPRGADVREAVVQEGFDTICIAPLLDDTQVLGLLNIYHDRPHQWTPDELDTVAELARQASVAIRAAQDYERMARWAAQLQSIQQLGARLNRLTKVDEIGFAIATELRQLIDYHNVRVYRRVGDDLLPVAMVGQVGEYVDETTDQLRVVMGEGITGWVAEHRVAQNLGDAASDPRAHTIPGTEDDLDESMLLAPMVFDDQVLGVVVLSKLGLNRFTDDDLRLLVIYASFAAQAMANADTTERLREQTIALERQLRGQRELLQVTETILTKLDVRDVLDAITERIGGLIACDNIAIEILDSATGVLKPLTARGVHADRSLEPRDAGDADIASWVVAHNEPAYIGDERSDPRVGHEGANGRAHDGSVIATPLRRRTGAVGVITLERLGAGNTFSIEEFELVQLFAAQVSIALQNAEVFEAVEIRARTDDLTGLLNHGTFQQWLDRSVHEGTPFSLIMLDLDNFRDVNNDLGHQAGDEVLRRIARALVRAGRDSDLVFRYGGDEFTYILPGTDEAGAFLVADRVRLAVAATSDGVGASVGVASFPGDGTTSTAMLLAADRACLVAKRSGRDRVVTAVEGRALGEEVPLQEPTPVDSAVMRDGLASADELVDTAGRDEEAAVLPLPRQGR
jgi:diguanylate cyclase (GGDEF)-like protein/excisionase family DNA binding protein